jgi:TATA-box binding protein (TBP) (component of TFIID and TFIIIB)
MDKCVSFDVFASGRIVVLGGLSIESLQLMVNNLAMIIGKHRSEIVHINKNYKFTTQDTASNIPDYDDSITINNVIVRTMGISDEDINQFVLLVNQQLSLHDTSVNPSVNDNTSEN